MCGSPWRGLTFLAFALLGACGQDLPGGIKIPDLNTKLGLNSTDSDPSVEKLSPDATIPILLSSNKPDTSFTVNGAPLSAAKSVKVLVPATRLEITARAPCYQTLKQVAEKGQFDRASQFVFNFARWDRLPNGWGPNCV